MMRAPARLAAEVQAFVEHSIRPGVVIRDLDALAENAIRKAGGTPAMMGYRGYPAATCISIDDELVNVIPDGRILAEGSLVKVVVAVVINGWYGQTASSTVVGVAEPRVTRFRSTVAEALAAAIRAATPTGHVGDIGAAISASLESAGYFAIRDFVGHGIGRKLHEDPQVACYGKIGKRDRLQPGMVLSIDALAAEKKPEIYVTPDGWGAKTVDGGLAAHFKHTVAIRESGPEILSTRPG